MVASSFAIIVNTACVYNVLQVELNNDQIKAVQYECHTFQYYTLLEVIIGLSCALQYLIKVIIIIIIDL